MRVVERKMCEAIARGKSAQCSSNTHVEVSGDVWTVYLFGKIIAMGTLIGSVDSVQRFGGFQFTLAGWPTVTTRSRLNALLEYRGRLAYNVHGVIPGKLYQRQGVTYYKPPGPWPGRFDKATRLNQLIGNTTWQEVE